ncbi:hypothetical protein [Xenophilus azovorans]|uniref:hypothetical protein n=1 Tax=Xenophilus TaxID=151754 RepID=UPI0012ED7A16|nr:hypothetical protein [Xenophilus azovorans]
MRKEADRAASRCRNVMRSVLAATTLVILTACGGGSGGGTTSLPGSGATSTSNPGNGATGSSPGGGSAGTATSPPLREQIAALEQSGGYPKLDRSGDIAGPDANANGVRDDIESWINMQSLSDLQKRALLQKARALQNTLLVDLNDRTALQKAGEGLMASTNCGSLHFSPYREFSNLAGQIEAMTANTRQRAERYMKYNAARSGSSTRLPDGNTCES